MFGINSTITSILSVAGFDVGEIRRDDDRTRTVLLPGITIHNWDRFNMGVQKLIDAGITVRRYSMPMSPSDGDFIGGTIVVGV